MRSLFTDLAMEAYSALNESERSGIEAEEEESGGITVTRVQISSAEAAKRMKRGQGVYITIAQPELPHMEAEEKKAFAEKISECLTELIPKDGCVLAVGLGNRRMTADTLGSRVCEKLLITRHLTGMKLTKAPLRAVCSITPGVLGQTGLESAELTAALVKRFSPACVIAIDALAAQSPERICTTVQLANSGISPGSGVGNHRTGLSEEALGIPIIAIGVPMVVYSSAIARNALTGLLGGEGGEYAQEIDELCRQASVVTPREVDALVESVSETLAWGINMALQPDISGEEAAILMQ